MSWYYNEKRICEKCNKKYIVEVSTLEKAKKDFDKCPYCNKNKKVNSQ